MYEKEVTIEPFMTDQEGTLSVRYLTFLLSDIMERNASSYGASAAFHHERNLVWVLVEYDIKIHAMPGFDETVFVGTLPYSFKRMFGYRIYRIRDAKNTVLLEGKGKFVLMNRNTKELVKPDDAILHLFTDAKKEPEALPFDKVKPKKDNLLYEVKTPVLYSYIDINGHMNNAIYVALCYDFLKKSLVLKTLIRRLKVFYKKEAFYGEQLSLKYYQEDDGIFVELYSQDVLCSQVFFITKKG